MTLMHPISGRCDLCQPVFSPQTTKGCILFCSSSSYVTALSESTGDLLYKLRGHNSDIKAMFINPDNQSQLISVEQDGKVIVWDYNEQKPIKSISGLFEDVEDMIGWGNGKCIIFAKYNNLLIKKCEERKSDEFFIPVNERGQKHVFLFDLENEKVLGSLITLNSFIPRFHLLRDRSIKSDEVVHSLDQKEIDYVVLAESHKIYLINLTKALSLISNSPSRVRRADMSSVVEMIDILEFLYQSMPDISISILTASSHTGLVATGMSNGIILFWHNIFKCILSKSESEQTLKRKQISNQESRSENDKLNQSKVVQNFSKRTNQLFTTQVHWHAHRVSCIQFSIDGTFLLSGGEEAVLVLWHLDTFKNTFWPRFGTPLKWITLANDQANIAVCLANNSIIFSRLASFRSIWKHFRLALSSLYDTVSMKHLLKIIREPSNGFIVFNGHPGHLQFFDATNDRMVRQLEVVYYNRVSRTEDNILVQPPVVEHVSFSNHGVHMATVDIRLSISLKKTRTILKFWDFIKAGHTYIPNTSVESPHNDHPINSVVFHPTRTVVVTTSAEDKQAKLWVQHRKEIASTRDTKYIPKTFWSCLSNVEYKEMSPQKALFSHDGSTLAVVFPECISLWSIDITPIKLLHVINNFSPKPLKDIVFLPGLPFIVAITDSSLFVWNISTLCLCWSLEAKHIFSICVGPSERFYGQLIVAFEVPGNEGAQHEPNSKLIKNTQIMLLRQNHNSFDVIDAWQLNPKVLSICPIITALHESLLSFACLTDEDQLFYMIPKYKSKQNTLLNDKKRTIGVVKPKIRGILPSHSVTSSNPSSKTKIVTSHEALDISNKAKFKLLYNFPTLNLPVASLMFKSFVKIYARKRKREEEEEEEVERENLEYDMKKRAEKEIEDDFSKEEDTDEDNNSVEIIKKKIKKVERDGHAQSVHQENERIQGPLSQMVVSRMKDEAFRFFESKLGHNA